MGRVVSKFHLKPCLPHHLSQVVVLQGRGLAVKKATKILEAEELFTAEVQNEVLDLGARELSGCPCRARDPFEGFPGDWALLTVTLETSRMLGALG
jgi:hypothetical protein